jgi:hypothetical protein
VGPGKPAVQSSHLSLLDHLYKALSQLIEVLQISMGVADALDERSLVCRELLLVCDKRSAKVVRGQPRVRQTKRRTSRRTRTARPWHGKSASVRV